ncbi:PREDICTED: pentatricopeptide repeat-containing protein DOT4, chloroplastic-like [Nelumbo nucifera]|uniref:Uncharacterized protein n=2 Tax=Nelumbo nucifera TaxID=4432 RepID=A0A822ZT74_NELNU|nr:PREDICTED: pentatricopeptide repeat-containing protein DOT4, chloroplastic-like [Nelumbo nucifera]DAD46106.1 TPA_asm: hypothetical protein HUJ06_004336 [Nelumbo nucifera]
MRTWILQRGVSSFSFSHLRIPAASQFNDLLQRCSDSVALKQGRQVHQQIILHELAFDPFTVTKLVQMYAACNDLISARILFDELPRPNVFAWTSIISFYSRNGMFKECVRTYNEMKLQGIGPDGYVFPKVLRACTQSLSLAEGIRIHKDIIELGAEHNLQVCNSLIDMYSKCGDVQTAQRIFNGMAEKDLLTWNSMISGFVCNDFLDIAIEQLDAMRSEGFEPDLVTWNTIMDAYCRMGLCNKALEIFEQIREPNIISLTTLISGYSRIGNHEMPLVIFREMMSKQEVCPDPDALSSVLVSCRHMGVLRSGQEIHAYGIKTSARIEFYNSSGPALLTVYATSGRLRDARNVFQLMDKSDVVTWNAMILGLVHLGLGDLAIKYVREMQSRGLQYDETTVSTVLPVCDLRFGKQIHAYIRRNALDSAISVWNALINMYSKCGCIRSAYTVFSKMDSRDVVSWNTMIGGYGMNGCGKAALQLLLEMKQSGFQPNSATFTSLLSACSHSGLVDDGLQLFDSLINCFDFSPRMEHFACVVDLLARAGKLEEAVDFIHNMPINPDKSIWGALLSACQAHQNINFGRLAAEHLFHLEPENPGNYVTLSNIYAKAGRWDDAVRVRKLMEEKRLMKPSGYSWIETKTNKSGLKGIAQDNVLQL